MAYANIDDILKTII